MTAIYLPCTARYFRLIRFFGPQMEMAHFCAKCNLLPACMRTGKRKRMPWAASNSKQLVRSSTNNRHGAYTPVVHSLRSDSQTYCSPLVLSAPFCALPDCCCDLHTADLITHFASPLLLLWTRDAHIVSDFRKCIGQRLLSFGILFLLLCRISCFFGLY